MTRNTVLKYMKIKYSNYSIFNDAGDITLKGVGDCLIMYNKYKDNIKFLNSIGLQDISEDVKILLDVNSTKIPDWIIKQLRKDKLERIING